MTTSYVQIIYLNGPSSSGKTTLAKALQDALQPPFLHVSIDKIIGWMPEKLNDWMGGKAPLGFSWQEDQDERGHLTQELQVGPYAQKIIATFHMVVVALAKMGHHLIVDDVSFGKQQVDAWKRELQDFQVLWVGVNAPLAILEEREKQRASRIIGSARGQFRKVHVDVTYDLQVDTHQVTLQNNVKEIKSKATCARKQQAASITQMKITLVKATKSDKETIQNLGRFYVYEMSRYCGFLPHWQTPADGLFECRDFSSYTTEPERHAFLIKVDGELAGFVLINKIGSTPDVDWNVGEFFVIAKFQGKGVGRYVAEQIFNQFPGRWETAQMLENKSAIDFWEKVVSQYSQGRFEITRKVVPKPQPHPMIILKFNSKK